MATSTTNYATVVPATTSDCARLRPDGRHRIDVDGWAFGVTYTIQTDASTI